MDSKLYAQLSTRVLCDGSYRLPKLPCIVKARFVSRKAEYVSDSVATYTHVLTMRGRAKIKEAGGVVSLIA